MRTKNIRVDGFIADETVHDECIITLRVSYSECLVEKFLESYLVGKSEQHLSREGTPSRE
jgi:hypothetical protein